MNSPKLIYAESTSFDPYFNLSLEKFLFENVEEGEVIFYLWQNEKTVVCGRNQNVFKECNLSAIKDIGGKVARRESGGGAVYHDLGNLNFTFIAKGDLYDIDKNLKVIETAVSSFDLSAERTGRNDITINGKKFSGNAFHKIGDRYCHHGTIMVDVDTSILSNLLNVNREKLKSKGVDSVESRVINLHNLNSNITVETIKDKLKESFLAVFDAGSFIKTIDTNNIDSAKYRNTFASENWIFGKNPDFTNTIEKWFDWGNIEFCFEIKEDMIKSSRVFSDSLTPNFVLAIEEKLNGIKYDAEAICKVITDVSKTCDENVSASCKDITTLIHSSI